MGIHVEGVEKRFGSVVAVRELYLTAYEGELVAIVGPSGCGKTTLLRAIAGLEHPDRGRIVIQGIDVTRLAPEKRDVGFVFQQFALFPNMNVEENIAYGLKRKRVLRHERERRVADLIEMIGLTGLEKRRSDQLSAGQQQRVALARALGPRPKTLLLDEPFSALDAAIRERLRDDLKKMQRNLKITTIMVTHDQHEALAVADRVAVMNDGRLEQIGTPWDLYDKPETDFVATFIGQGNYFSVETKGSHVHVQGLGDVGWEEVPPSVQQRLKMSGPVTVLVRPDAVILGSKDTKRAFVLDGVIQDLSFGGERSLVEIQVTDHPHIRLISAVSGPEARFVAKRIGEAVSISIGYDRLRWVPSSSGLDTNNSASSVDRGR